MRIGFDAKRAFNNRTGLGNYSRFVLNALHNYAPGHTYLAYTPKIKTGLFDEFPEESIRMPNSTNPLFGAWWRSYGIKKALSQDSIQVFHGLSNELPNGLHKAGIKSVVTIHDLIFLRYPELYPAIDRFFYRQKFRNACAEADVIVAVSEQTKRDIVAFYGTSPEKIQVVYQDCHEAFHAPQTSQVFKTWEVSPLLRKYNIDTPYVLSVGTIEARKNQLHLVKAFHAAQLEDAELVLVGGKTSYQREIEIYIAQHQLAAKVKILNSVPFADLPSLYRSARVFAYPSFFEGFGIPIVEALHSGVPVVAATGSCLEEAGGKGGVYVDPGDVHAFAQTLTGLWHDETLRKTLIQDGQKHIHQFAAAKIAKELMEIYASLQS
ncbi:glycosyltransferase family 4 protein [Runella slithyformis]|uniref:Glycosyl transferase group 1 n=1 Tax=Runella slithyformis (strain ATCC 29530 / DSM 19594 / LMG 11500 / NCIMB 11436 / LSU 4) TaxID=761193 RepID=A0A7U4E5U8_RUNSL|nr:glycosyltransferase family 1 protein [Runella slithyformis]AEI48568.1 glycosyl transferase group 1 [Runella slithyformis DSM 19594]